MHQDALFGESLPRNDEVIDNGALLMRQFATADASALLEAVHAVAERAPWRHLTTPRGFSMSVAMTNCGDLGWVSDRRGYRYEASDPTAAQPWPAMPEVFRALAERAAAHAGYVDFAPEACLINRYAVGARMGLHQDKDEPQLDQPIVSVSLGLPATFLWGRVEKGGPTTKYTLHHGDVVVWGGPSRLTYHGIAPLKPGSHPLTGDVRYNLTFRCAGKGPN